VRKKFLILDKKKVGLEAAILERKRNSSLDEIKNFNNITEVIL